MGDVPYMEWGSGAEGYCSLRGSDVNLYWFAELTYIGHDADLYSFV